MSTEPEIKEKGMKALLKEFGELDTEIFIKMIHREPFDYTEWQEDLWSDKTMDQLSRKAMKHQKNKN
jgi:hypothetical protein